MDNGHPPRRLSRWAAALVFFASAAIGSAHAELSPDLLEALRAAGPGEKVPVMILFDRQGLSLAERQVLRALPRAQRRAQGRALLESRAAAAQMDLRGYLGRLEGEGTASDIRPLWIINAVLARLAPDNVYDLDGFAGVRRVIWDPPVPPAAMMDAGTDRGVWDGPAGYQRADSIAWQLTSIRAPEAWELGYDGAGVLVGVIDSGMDYNHTDLAGRLYINPGEIPGNGLDDDANGFVDDWRGWDFVLDDNDPMEDGSGYHGTHVCGLVAGDGTGGVHTGVAPGARILPIKALGGTWGTIVEAINYAVLMDVDVVQMSISQKWGQIPKPDYAAWRIVTDNELALGYLHCNSIGNEGDNQDSDPIPFNVSAPGNSPPPWIDPGQYIEGRESAVLGVGSLDREDYVDDASSRGPSVWENIGSFVPGYPFPMPPEYWDYPYFAGPGGLSKPDLTAPGNATVTTHQGSGYTLFYGTSAATPLVAGAAAVLVQADSTLTPEDLARYLQSSTVDLGAPGRDNIYGSGKLDVRAALQMVLDRAQEGRLAGMVLDEGGGQPLVTAALTVLDPPYGFGVHDGGQFDIRLPQGMYNLAAACFGYQSDTLAVTVAAGGETVVNFHLEALPTSSIFGRVTDTQGAVVPGVRVALRDTPVEAAQTDSAGLFRIPAAPVGIPFVLEAVRFGNHVFTAETKLVEGLEDTVDVVLGIGVRDDFETDQGWTLDPSDTALLGRWERGDPVATWFGNTMVQPDSDYTAAGTHCFLTQNCNPGASQEYSDVDRGQTTLLSPVFDGTVYYVPALTYRRWYSNNTGGATDDVFRAEASSDGGATWVTLEAVSVSARAWVPRTFNLRSYLTPTTEMRLRFVASDLGITSIVEAAIDEVAVGESVTGLAERSDAPQRGRLRLLGGAPSPMRDVTTLRFELPADAHTDVTVHDVQGRLVCRLVAGQRPEGLQTVVWDGRDGAGRSCGSGVYLYRVEQQGQSARGRLVLIR